MLISSNSWNCYLNLFGKWQDKDLVLNKRQNNTMFKENKSFLHDEFCVLACIGTALEKRRCHLSFLLNMLLNACGKTVSKLQCPQLWRDWGHVTTPTELLLDLTFLSCTYWPAFSVDSLCGQISQPIKKARERPTSSVDVYCQAAWPSLTKVVYFACVILYFEMYSKALNMSAFWRCSGIKITSYICM